SGVMQPDGDLPDFDIFQISPDSLYAVYRADAETDTALDIYSVRTTGEGDPVRLGGALPDGMAVSQFGITSDSSQVVAIAPWEDKTIMELFAVPIGGGAYTRLNSDMVTGGNVTTFAISPDG